MLLLAVIVLLGSALGRSGGSPAPLAAPGGLPLERTPQFVLLTHDDGVSWQSAEMLQSVTDGRQTPNGCQLTATLFAKIGNTNCDALLELYKAGYEVADHTVSHKRLAGAELSFVESEILGARRQLAEGCGIPLGDIVGLRAPFLEVDPAVRRVLHQNGFLYDSSLVEDTLGSSASRGFGARLWPFEMAGGIPMNCSNWEGEYGTHRQMCEPGESYPGLWEVPVWRMGELGGPFHMDPGYGYSCMCHASEHSALDILKAHFDAAYAGNRAPFPLYVHPFWLREGSNLEQLQQFADYTLSQPDVYWITMRQLIAWLQNPIPADELTPEALGCGNPGGAGGALLEQPAALPQAAPAPSPAPAPAGSRERRRSGGGPRRAGS